MSSLILFFRNQLDCISLNELLLYSVDELLYLVDENIKKENEKFNFITKVIFEATRYHISHIYSQNPYVREIPKLEFAWDKEYKKNLDTIGSEDEFYEFVKKISADG